jgi:type IV pilus assembly protein PilY1
VTAPPELLLYKGKRIVYIGTGRILDSVDFGNSAVQTMYAIADGTTLTNARSNLVQQFLDTTGTGSLTSNAVDWTTQRGWFVDLPAGEQANTRPVIAYGGLTFVTNKTGGADCSASSRMYVIDVYSGSKFAGSDFVSWVVSATSNATGAIAILTRDGRTVRAVSREYETARTKEKDVTPAITIPPGKNAWREIRR